MAHNQPRDLTNPEEQQQMDTRDNRWHKVWIGFSVCVLGVAATIIVVREPPSSMVQSTTSTQVAKKTGWAVYEVDTDINPCDDFYKFACNKWQHGNPRPDWSPEWGVDAFVDERITKTVIEIVEQSKNNEDLKVMRQAKDLYQKCLLNEGDHNSGDIFMENLWKNMGGMYGRSLQRGNIVPSRAEMCGSLVHRRFQFAFLHKLLQHNYKDRSELENIITEVEAMFENIKHAFDKTESRSFIESTKDTKICAGYPKWIFNSSKVQAGYDWLNLNKNQSFREQMLYISNSDRDLFEEGVPDYECNMWYMKSENPRPKDYNELYLPMRILEPPFFDLSRHRAINYGSLGTIVSSIMASSYIDWRSNTPANCLETQNSWFTVDFGDEVASINGKQTLKSSLEENVALQVAYAAFSGVTREVIGEVDYTTSSTSKSRSGNQFSSDQLFFLGYAQLNCQTWSKEEMKLVMERSSRSPNMFHFLLPLYNFNGFAKAWNCPKGSNMNPAAEKKCQVL